MATQIATEKQFDAPELLPFEDDTLTRLFFGTVDRKGGPNALRFKQGGQWASLSHCEVETRVAQLAAALAGLGIGRGERVALLSENRPEWAITDYAVLGLGAADVPIYPTLPANQIAYILKDCGAKAILVSTREQLDKVREVRSEVPSLQHVISFDDPGASEGILHFPAVLEDGARAIQAGAVPDFREQALQVKPDDLATLIYTSGTTGNPKGVMLTHHNLASNVAAVDQHQILDLKPGEVALSFLPLSHVFERLVDYFYWHRGVCIAYAESIDKVADNLMEVKPHYMVSVPRLFEKIHTRVMGATGIKKVLVGWAARVGEEYADRRLQGETPSGGLAFQYRLADRLVFSKLRERTGGRLIAAISGGAPLSAEVAKFFLAAGLPVYEGYGLTETSPVLTANRPGQIRLGSVGLAVPGTELRIDPSGEILARGPQIMKGYWNAAEATAEAIDAEGWFHTGDVGIIDDGGFLRITDRIKNMIVTAGGKNIAPQPIENRVAMSPLIAHVVMLGDRRAYPALLVVPDFDNLDAWARTQGIDPSDRERLAADPRVRELLEREAFGRLEGLAGFEMPKKLAVVPREFSIEAGELTPKLSIKRRVVEEHFRDLIEQMYAA